MPDLDKIAERPGWYLWETGLGPFIMGSFFFLIGTAFLTVDFIPDVPIVKVAALFAGTGLFFGIDWLGRYIKERKIFPRGGYVEPRRDWKAATLGVLPVFVLTVLWKLSTRNPHANFFFDNAKLLLPGYALWSAGSSLYYYRKFKSPASLAFGIYLICFAPLLWWLPLRPEGRFGLMSAAVGGPLGVYGALRLRKYLKTTPVQGEPADG
ncbi:MAG: hypothetical protein ABI824_15845 [Acidobacteriota bacterium]